MPLALPRLRIRTLMVAVAVVAVVLALVRYVPALLLLLMSFAPSAIYLGSEIARPRAPEQTMSVEYWAPVLALALLFWAATVIGTVPVLYLLIQWLVGPL